MTTVADKELTGTQTIDASTLADGIHTLHYQIVDDQGTAGIPFSAMFLKLGQDNTCVNVLEYENGQWRLMLLNSTVHLNGKY